MNKDFKSIVYNDKALIGISWIATCSFVVMTLIRKRRFPCESSLIINIYLGLAVFAAYFLFACLVESDLKGTFLILLFRVFDGTYKRLCLLLFWLLCAIESILFSIMINCRQRKANTTHRKFFHLTISLIIISGLYNDPLFLALSGHLMLQIFIIIETFRNQRIEPWSNFLDQMFLIFIDGQDSHDLILTPIFLLAGMFLPLFLDTTMLYSPHWTLKQRHFSGVLSVGVGDSFAAIVGSRFGRIPWPFGFGNKSRKTIEGSIAMFFTQIIASEIIFGFCSLNLSLILSAMVSTIAEAQLNSGDNLIIPFCSAITFYLFE
uniref:dolichol kinase n=1 Tax=Meloidogyne incognita TaxID=6306 RepID=A0A914MBP7_MELIC